MHAGRRAKAVSGSLEELAQAAERGLRVDRAVFVLMQPGEFLDRDRRDELWRQFEVPVYALLLGSDGRPIAWECEAQDGYHGDCGDSHGEDACPCGRPGARLMAQRAEVPSLVELGQRARWID